LGFSQSTAGALLRLLRALSQPRRMGSPPYTTLAKSLRLCCCRIRKACGRLGSGCRLGRQLPGLWRLRSRGRRREPRPLREAESLVPAGGPVAPEAGLRSSAVRWVGGVRVGQKATVWATLRSTQWRHASLARLGCQSRCQSHPAFSNPATQGAAPRSSMPPCSSPCTAAASAPCARPRHTRRTRAAPPAAVLPPPKARLRSHCVSAVLGAGPRPRARAHGRAWAAVGG
jgi:hypothetical protein